MTTKIKQVAKVGNGQTINEILHNIIIIELAECDPGEDNVSEVVDTRMTWMKYLEHLFTHKTQVVSL